MPEFAPTRLLYGLVTIGFFFAGQSLQAQNKYDVLARTLQPYGALFYSKAKTKAMQADVILREGPPIATEILHQRLRVSLQMPNKLRIETLDPQHRIIFCRDGQRLWAYPRDFAASITAAGQASNGETRIPDFRLPIKDQQIVLIPVLFQILRFEPSSDADGEPAWDLDFRLAPEIAQAMKCENWIASAVVKQTDFQVRRLRIESNNWTGTLDVLASQFETAFPPQTWEVEPALESEATSIPPERFGSALERLSAIPIPR